MRGKRIVYIFAMFIIITALGGCQSKDNKKDEAKDNTKNNTSKETSNQDYYFEFQEEKIYLLQPVEEVIKILGEDFDYLEAASCAGEGVDYFYYYQNLTLIANDIEGEKCLTGIYFKNDTVATAEGIRIGSEYAEVLEKYGSDYDANGSVMEYRGKTMVLAIGVSEGKVVSVEYMYNCE